MSKRKKQNSSRPGAHAGAASGAAAGVAGERATFEGLVAGILRREKIMEVHADATRDLRPDVLGGDGRMQVLPADFWADTTVAERALFANRAAVYGLPTVELVDRIAGIIDGRDAIEIGAGCGVLADALGIVATDSMQQADPHYRAMYQRLRVPPITYGPNVVKADASEAVRRYRPQVVVASWVTHRYDPARHEAGGNEVGVDWDDVLAHCQTLIFVGNSYVHGTSTLWRRAAQVEYGPSYVYSRATNGTPDFVAVWDGTATGT